MAKKAPMSLGAFAAKKPGAATPTPSAPASDLTGQEQTRAGRPRTLPDNVRSMTLRLSDETHTALNVLAAQHRTTAKAILLAGLADQFARYGVTAEVK